MTYIMVLGVVMRFIHWLLADQLTAHFLMGSGTPQIKDGCNVVYQPALPNVSVSDTTAILCCWEVD